jgi:hypothetical protein
MIEVRAAWDKSLALQQKNLLRIFCFKSTKAAHLFLWKKVGGQGVWLWRGFDEG